MVSKKVPSRTTQIRQKRVNNNNSLPTYLALSLVILSCYLTWQKQTTNISFTNNDSSFVYSDRSRQKQITPQATEIGSKYLGNNDYTNLDRQAVSLNYQGKSVSELAALLSKYAFNDLDKARIIYAWIAYHIVYDAQGFLSGQYPSANPEVVMTTRQAVCGGYANLYQALATEMGLEAVVIEGYARAYDYGVGNSDLSSSEAPRDLSKAEALRDRANHAWNAVKIDGDWYLLDVTWGAGTLDNEQFKPNFNSFYFATAPAQFIYEHFPSNSAWQLLSKPYSKEEFKQLPDVSSQFFKNGLEIVSHQVKTINTDRRGQIVLKAPEDTVISARIQQNSQTLPATYHFIQRKDGYFAVDFALPTSGNYDIMIFAKKQTDPAAYLNAIAYQIINNNTNNNLVSFPLVYDTFYKNTTYLYEPLMQNLPVNQSIFFKLDLPQALEVKVIDSNSETWTPLERLGNTFQGYVPISNGKVYLVAKFSEGSQYWTVLEYN